ncbi:MAG: sulfotransferase [Bdellovibrionaceae bacterium]|nr:sulfotransferase [Pseudobdellovibrionaceae bacterium]
MRKPNLFIIGAMKSGTTTLHAVLDRHPDIFMSPDQGAALLLRARDAAGIPLIRGVAIVDTLHPIYEGSLFRWHRDPTDAPDLVEFERAGGGRAAARAVAAKPVLRFAGGPGRGAAAQPRPPICKTNSVILAAK